MIILKNKSFTRAEKEAIKELLYRTRGLRKFPEGTNLKRGHSQRLGNMAADIEEWVNTGKKPNIENMKEVLSQWGLPKNAAAIDKIIDKYSNKKAIARLERMRKGKFEPSFTYDEKKMEKMGKRAEEVQKRFKIGNTKLGKLPETKEDASLSRKLKKRIKSEQIPVITVKPKDNRRGSTYATISPQSFSSKLKLKERIAGINGAINMRSGRAITPKMESTLKKSIKKDSNKPIIVLPTKSHPAPAYHEKGHIDFANTPAGKRVEYGNISNALARLSKPSINSTKHPTAGKINNQIHSISDSLSVLAHENGASEHAIRDLIKNGASKEKLRESMDILRAGGNTYLDSLGHSIAANNALY